MKNNIEEEVLKLRYDHHRERLKDNINQALQERRRITLRSLSPKNNSQLNIVANVFPHGSEGLKTQ